MLSVYEKNIKIIYKSNQQNDIIEMCIKYSPAERQKLCNRKLWKKFKNDRRKYLRKNHPFCHSAISQFVSAILCMIHLMRVEEEYRLELRMIRFDRHMLKQIIQNGVPSGLQNSAIAIANVFVQSNINAFGKMAMALTTFVSPMIVMLCDWCLFRVSYITVAVRLISDIRVIFWAYPLTWSISSVIFLYLFLRGKWVYGFEKENNKQY